jgi:hypothetical protein
MGLEKCTWVVGNVWGVTLVEATHARNRRFRQKIVSDTGDALHVQNEPPFSFSLATFHLKDD